MLSATEMLDLFEVVEGLKLELHRETPPSRPAAFQSHGESFSIFEDGASQLDELMCSATASGGMCDPATPLGRRRPSWTSEASDENKATPQFGRCRGEETSLTPERPLKGLALPLRSLNLNEVARGRRRCDSGAAAVRVPPAPSPRPCTRPLGRYDVVEVREGFGEVPAKTASVLTLTCWSAPGGGQCCCEQEEPCPKYKSWERCVM